MSVKQFLRIFFIALFSLVLVLIIGTALFFQLAPQVGGSPSPESKVLMQRSPQFDGELFHNSVPTTMDMDFAKSMSLLPKYFQPAPGLAPEKLIETQLFEAEKFAALSDSALAISWFGHSSVLLRIEGKNLLIDPVFGKRASMFSFLGPERYPYRQHVGVADLPPIDAVLISHDHYDHLDYETFQSLRELDVPFFVPLGVAAHLLRWGIAEQRIQEFDWWEEGVLGDSLKLAFTPARHFSGRGLTNRFQTLWGSWVVMGQQERVFFSGDSGYTLQFQEIGERYGPFDLAMMECGQYNENWTDIHMMPEETVQANLDLRARWLIPIHWGKYTLAFHSWQDPVKRVLAAAQAASVQIAFPPVNAIWEIPAKSSEVATRSMPGVPKEAESIWWQSYQ